MKTWPLRRKIAGWSALATAIALLTFSAVVAFALYSEQVEMIDDRLAATAMLLSARATPAAPVDLATLEALSAPGKHRRQASTALYGFAILSAKEGGVIEAHPDALRSVAQTWPLPKRHFNRTLGSIRLRLGAFPLGTNTVLLAAPLEPADESVRDLVGAALIAIPAVLLVVAAGSWWIARRALRPVAELTRAAATITATQLSARLPTRANDDEIAALVRVLNEMFDRLQRSFEQATRFTADAAHELRTPLTILRGQIEDALRSNGPAANQEQLLLGLLEETTGLQKITDNLLLLARFDSGKTHLALETLPLSTLMADAIEDAELLAADQHIVVIAEIAPGLEVKGDATMLRRVALNLVDNAIKYNRANGELRASLHAEGDEAVFRIGNTGAGITAERRAGLFERFYRPDAGRTRESGGSGLGLSLCREIVNAHGGTIELTRSDADWTELTIRLPLKKP